MNSRSLTAVVACVFILGVVNFMITGKEKHLADGRVVYLELAPVDPRSMMQGDYMALNYRIVRNIQSAMTNDDQTHDGRIVVTLDEQDIATFARVDDGQALAENEILMRYRIRSGQVKFVSNAFFFQEGQDSLYEPAKYGQFRVDAEGELLLSGLHDQQYG